MDDLVNIPEQVSQELLELRQKVDELEQANAELKRAEIQLGDKSTQWELFLKATNDLLWNWDFDDDSVIRSASFERVFGYSTKEVTPIISWWVDRLHDEDRDRVLSAFQKTVDTGEDSCGYEYRFQRKDGSYSDIIDRVFILRDENGVAVRALGAMTDITNQKQLEHQMGKSENLNSLGILAGGIAHEFNNVLSPILGFTEMLLKESSGKQQDYLNRIFSASERAKELVTQILAFSQKSSSERTTLQLKTTVYEVLKLIEYTLPSSILIQQDLDTDILNIVASSHEMQQVITNLCINASHAMPEGGTLEISLKNGVEGSCRNFSGKAIEGPFIVLCVKDTGHGIVRTKLERIFDPFYTTKKQGAGTGLGLSIVLGIVEQHGGHISVESRLGIGTTFEICLPATADEQENIPKTEASHPSMGEERILLVDDEEMLVDVATALLKQLGFHVTAFTDSEEALDWFEINSNDIDLVVTDYAMPKMTGRELSDKLRIIQPEIPIVLSTGFGHTVTVENVRSWGINALLVKPYRQEEIGSVIRRVIDDGLSKKHLN